MLTFFSHLLLQEVTVTYLRSDRRELWWLMIKVKKHREVWGRRGWSGCTGMGILMNWIEWRDSNEDIRVLCVLDSEMTEVLCEVTSLSIVVSQSTVPKGQRVETRMDYDWDSFSSLPKWRVISLPVGRKLRSYSLQDWKISVSFRWEWALRLNTGCSDDSVS